MKRRAFIAGLGTVAAWPLVARAQQSEKMRHVEALIGWSASDPEPQADLTVFRSELAKLGWTENRDLRIDVHFGEGDAGRMRTQAAEIVRLAPDVIFTVSAAATRAMQQETRTIPIVVAGAGSFDNGGLVQNAARPERNVTGFANTLSSVTGKQLQLLTQIAPGLNRVAYIVNANTAISGNVVNPAGMAAARNFGVEWITTPFHDVADLDTAVDSFASQPDGGLLINGGVVILRKEMLGLAARHRLPMISAYRSYPAEGGLMSYGSDTADWYRVAALYVDRILRGATPSDLPMQFASKFQLVINHKTARSLGLAVPPTLLAIADEVIE